MDIGKIGIWTSYRPFGVERAGEAAKLVEQLGYGAWWVGGSPHVPDVRPILEATSTLVAATGILNVWSNDPAETAAADAALRADFPGRFMLGIGIGHPEATSDYRRPLHGDARVPRRPRRVAGPAPGRRALPGRAGPEDARPRRRAHRGHASRTSCPSSTRGSPASGSVRASSWRPRWRASSTPTRCAPRPSPATTRSCTSACATTRRTCSTFGFTERDLADGGSDRLIDAVIPQGSAEQIAEVVRAHLDAGADHVCLQPLGEEGIPRESWTALANALIG